MAIETHAKKIKNFALKIIGAGPERGQGVECRRVAAEFDFESHALLARNREQVINHLEPWFRRIPVHAGHIGQIIERTIRVVFQNSAGLTNGRTIDINRHLFTIKLHALDSMGTGRKQTSNSGVPFQLFDICDRRDKSHYLPPRAVAPTISGSRDEVPVVLILPAVACGPEVIVSPQSSAPFFQIYQKPTSTMPI